MESRKRQGDLIIDLSPMRGFDFGAAHPVVEAPSGNRSGMLVAALAAIGFAASIFAVVVSGDGKQEHRVSVSAPDGSIASAFSDKSDTAAVAAADISSVDAAIPTPTTLRKRISRPVRRRRYRMPPAKPDAALPRATVDPEMAALVSEALGERKAQERKVAKKLPKRPTRFGIAEAMKKPSTGVRACFDHFRVPGLVDLRFRIMPDGRMSDLRIKGRFAGTPTAACVLAAVDDAHFPPFSGPPISIRFPFLLQ